MTKYYVLLLLFFANAAQAQDSTKKVVLDSVVVYTNGYQSIPKDRSTGSFTQVDNKTLNLQVGNSILSRLESVANGVAFNKKGGSIPAVMVRGLSTINGPTAPLIILDNFPFEGDINTIDPNLIESVTILKDATAASIWGTRAGNGVIVINTKKGKYFQAFTIDVTATTQVVAKPDLYSLHTIAPGDFIDMETYLYSKGFYSNALSSTSHPVISPVVELLDEQSRGLISADAANAQIAALRNNDIRSILHDTYYSNAVNQQYALQASGGNSLVAWSAGGGYDRNLSGLDAFYERKTFRLETSIRPFKHLQVTGSINYTGTNTRSGKDDFGSQRYLYPYSTLVDGSGKLVSFARDYRSTYTDTLGGGKLLPWTFYPTEDYQHNVARMAMHNILLNFGIHYDLPKGFSVDAKYQYEGQQQVNSLLQDDQSYYARSQVNLFSQISPTGVVTYNLPKGGMLTRSTAALASENFRAQLNYNHRSGKHLLTGILGNEIRNVHSTGEGYTEYGYNADLETGSITDYKTLFPLITTGQTANIPGGDVSFTDQTQRYVSYFGNAAYTYANRYNVNVSARRDASNLFGISTNDKWTPLWSAGAGWQISNEKFYHSSLLPFLKLRATYGYTGNADPNRSGVVTIFSFGNATNTGFPVNRIRQFPNPDLRWEKVAITNIGIDFRLKANRLTGSLEVYHKKGMDLFALSPVDITTGLTNTGIVKNVADMSGRGIDIVLNSINTMGKLQWTTGLLFTYTADKVTTAYANTTSGIFAINDGTAITAIPGLPVHAVMSLPFAGLDHITGNPMGYISGNPSMDYLTLTGTALKVADIQYNGPGLPQYFGSLLNTVTWKRLSFAVAISYKFHYFFKRTPLSYAGLLIDDKKSSDDYSRRWQQPGDEAFTNVPSMIYPTIANRETFYSSSAAIVEKGDHIRLEFINLAYAFPLKKTATGRWNLQAFANASNLGILWRANKAGLDPDYGTQTLAPAKAIALGIKLFFQ